jgi:uncharacterized glyoxalase superfamily protein PhnB
LPARPRRSTSTSLCSPQSERLRIATPGGIIAHAEVAIGGSVIIIGQNVPAQQPRLDDAKDARRLGCRLRADDDVFKRALEAEAKAGRALEETSTASR